MFSFRFVALSVHGARDALVDWEDCVGGVDDVVERLVEWRRDGCGETRVRVVLEVVVCRVGLLREVLL
jgi:hypothetical protein